MSQLYDLLEVLECLVDEALIEAVPAELASFCGDYYSPYYNFIYKLLTRLEIGSVFVELGVESGRGCYSALCAANGPVIGVDRVRHPRINELEEFLAFSFVHSPSLPVPASIPYGIKVLHIDTEHTYAQAKAEFDAYVPLLTDLAVVLFDDLHAAEDDVLKFFLRLPYAAIQCDKLHPTCGFGVVVYER